jgi:hypothetical protein
MTTLPILSKPTSTIEDRLTVVGEDGLTEDEREAAAHYRATAARKTLSPEEKQLLNSLRRQ